MGIVELLARISASLRLTGKSKVDFVLELNEYLPRPRPVDPANMITVYRWFTGKHKPRPAIIRAMTKWLEAQN